MEPASVIKKRRELLVKLLSIPAALMALENDVLVHNKKAHLLLNDDQMASYEERLEMRWEIFHIGGSNRALRGMDRWMNEITTFARSTEGTLWHQRALAALCMSHQLQGDVLGDKTCYAQADAAYTYAYRMALELDDAELMAATHLRKGVLLIGQKRPFEAIQMLHSALDTMRGRSLPTLKGNALQVLANAYARSQQPDACWRALDVAEGVLQQQREEEKQERSQRVFTAHSLIAHKGMNALLLGDAERAIALIEKSLTTYDPTLVPRRARLLAKKAEAYYKKQEIDTCAIVAEEALRLSHQVGASRVIARIQDLHEELINSRWRNDTYVRRLGALLATQ